MDIITSGQNPIIKVVNSLKDKKGREDKGQFFIEGIRFVEEAVRENAPIQKVVLSESFINNNDSRIHHLRRSINDFECIVLSDRLFKTLSDTETPQGILAVVKQNRSNLSEIPAENNYIAILEAIQDPGNLGTIIRTADAAGFTGIVLSKGCVDPYNPKVLRSTMGSIFHIPLYFSLDLTATINALKEKGIKTYAAHLKGRISYFDTGFRGNTAVMIGNEANGLSDEVSSLADVLVKIPMPGKAESLNASIAAALIMYEIVRQKLK